MIRISSLPAIALAVTSTFTAWRPVIAVEPATVVVIACGTAAMGFLGNEIVHRWKRQGIHPEFVTQLAQDNYRKFERQVRDLRDISLLTNPDQVIRCEQQHAFEKAHEHLGELQNNVSDMCSTIQKSLRECNPSSQNRLGQQLIGYSNRYHCLFEHLQELKRSAERTEEVVRLDRRLRDITQQVGILLGDVSERRRVDHRHILAHALAHNKPVADCLRSIEKMSQEAGTATRRFRELQMPELAGHAEQLAQLLKQQLSIYQGNEEIIAQLRQERGIAIDALREQLRQAHFQMEQLRQNEQRAKRRLSKSQEEAAALRLMAQRISTQNEERYERQLKSQARTYEHHIEQLEEKLSQYQSEKKALERRLRSLLERSSQQSNPPAPAAEAGSLACPPHAPLSLPPSVPLERGPSAGPGVLSRRAGGGEAPMRNVR